MKLYDINSVEAMQEFFSDVINLHGCTLHPDDQFSDMVDDKGAPAFKTCVASYLDQVMTACFAYCDRNGLDIYSIACEVQVREYKRLGLLPEDFGTTAGDDQCLHWDAADSARQNKRPQQPCGFFS